MSADLINLDSARIQKIVLFRSIGCGEQFNAIIFLNPLKSITNEVKRGYEIHDLCQIIIILYIRSNSAEPKKVPGEFTTRFR